MLDNIKSFLGIKLERVERLRQESVARNTDNADRAWPAPEMRQLADLFKGQLVNLVNAKHFYKSVTWKYQLAPPLMCSLRKAAFSPGSWKTHEKTHRTNPRFDSQPREPPPTALTGQESEEEDKKRSKVKRNSCRMQKDIRSPRNRGSQWNFRYFYPKFSTKPRYRFGSESKGWYNFDIQRLLGKESMNYLSGRKQGFKSWRGSRNHWKPFQGKSRATVNGCLVPSYRFVPCT